MDRKSAINHTLAGRSDYAHGFRDLRSANRARKRARNEREKYFSYRAVNRGQVGRPHYVSRNTLFCVDLPQDREIETMTKHELYREAQEYPRPPANHRSVKKRYPEWSKAARHEGRYKAKKWRDHQLRENSTEAQGIGFTYTATGDHAGYDVMFFGGHMSILFLQRPSTVETGAIDCWDTYESSNSGLQQDRSEVLGPNESPFCEDATAFSWLDGSDDCSIIKTSCFWAGCPGWFSSSEDRDGAWCNTCSTHHEDRATCGIICESRPVALKDCLPDSLGIEDQIRIACNEYADSTSEQDLTSWDGLDLLVDEEVNLSTHASEPNRQGLGMEWDIIDMDEGRSEQGVDYLRSFVEDEDWFFI